VLGDGVSQYFLATVEMHLFQAPVARVDGEVAA
jgi:hypothetical protein